MDTSMHNHGLHMSVGLFIISRHVYRQRQPLHTLPKLSNTAHQTFKICSALQRNASDKDLYFDHQPSCELLGNPSARLPRKGPMTNIYLFYTSAT